jgi:hypothetical protein
MNNSTVIVNVVKRIWFQNLFESVVTVAFQSVFYLKIYQNNIFFYFLKVIFYINASKWSKNIKNILIWNKKNKIKLIFFKNTFKI